jgi:hypothetical protein
VGHEKEANYCRICGAELPSSREAKPVKSL